MGLDSDQQMEDHDSLVTLIAVTKDMASDIKASRAELQRMNGELAASRLQIAEVQASLANRPQMIKEHNEIYGFYLTFKQFLWPLFLSGPVAALVSAVLTYFLLRHG